MLNGKTVFITGSSRGIGAGIARLAAKQYGAHVIVHGRTVSDELHIIAAEIGARTTAFDVSDREAVEREVRKLGDIDILINNVGINPSKTFMDLSNTDWQRIFDVNLFGMINVSRAALKCMLEWQRGSIVNIASIKGLTHVAGKPGYASAKSAVIRLTSSMAVEFALNGIRINAVAPGFTKTELTMATLDQEKALGKNTLRSQIDGIPVKRMADVEEIAEAVLFLASDRASYINGQCLAVDGGLSIV